MLGLGVLLAVLGFGSAILYLAGSPITFALMAMLDSMQPWIGFIVGLVGLALIWFGRKNKATTAPQSPTDGGYTTPGSGTGTGLPGDRPQAGPGPRQAPPARPADHDTPGSGTSTGVPGAGAQPAPAPRQAPPAPPAGGGTPGSGTSTGL